MPAELQWIYELYFSYKNFVESPSFLGNPYRALVETIQLHLGVPLVVISFEQGIITNVVDEEYRYIREQEHRYDVSQRGISLRNGIVDECILQTFRLKPIPYSKTVQEQMPLRSRLMKLKGGFILDYTRDRSKSWNIKSLEVFFDQLPNGQLVDDIRSSSELELLAKSIHDCLSAAIRCEGVTDIRHDALGASRPMAHEFRASFFEPIFFTTKTAVEKLLPQLHPEFEDITADRMLLQFFIIDPEFKPSMVLQFVPTQDQIPRFKKVKKETYEELEKKNLIRVVESFPDPLSFIRKYRWDVNRSFTAYACTTGCSVYSSNWHDEPLIKGLHLKKNERELRDTATVIMSMAQQTDTKATPVLLTVPWIVGSEIIGVLQINSRQALSPQVVRETTQMVKNLFNITELNLRSAEALGDLNTINQIQAFLMILEHDAPKFLSLPIVGTVKSMQKTINDHLEKPSAISKERVIEKISNRLPHLESLANHYSLFLQTLMGSRRLQMKGILETEEEFSVVDCCRDAKFVFEALRELIADICVPEFIPNLNDISVSFNVSKLQGTTIKGVKAILTAILINLLDNALKTLVQYWDDPEKNPIRSNPENGKVSVVISPDQRGGTPYLKILVRDRGLGMTEEERQRVEEKIDEIEQEILIGSVYSGFSFISTGIRTSRGRKGYGLNIVFNVLRQLSFGREFVRPRFERTVPQGMTITIWYPISEVITT